MSETLQNGRYVLTAQQGSGGMAVIYRAVDQELRRNVAIKILRPSLTKDPQLVDSFKEEARKVAKLSHPNIVTVHDVGSDGQTHYIVMEYVDGSDLKKKIRKGGAIPLEQALDISIQICEGIGYAHQQDLVHADVKPQNVLLTQSGKVKVTDFGIAQAFTGKPTGNTEPQQIVWGSPHYFAPEQAQGKRPTPASDVYSIGVVMFEMLTGQLPYTGENQQQLAMAHIRDEIPRVVDVAEQPVPEELSQIIYRTMNKNWEQRPPEADGLANRLKAYRNRSQRDTYMSVPPVPPKMSEPSANQPEQQPQQASERPLYYEPVKPSGTADPTQQYSIAPEAPPPPPSQRPVQPQPQASVSAPMQQSGEPGFMAGDSATYTGRSRPMGRFDQETSGLDAITIILAFLALISVACLLPLYYLVYLAYR